VRLGDLRPSRDLNYVSDTVDGFVRAATAEQAIGETINLGSGRDISIGDLVQLIAKLMGKTVDIEQEDARVRPPESEVDRLVANPARARQLLGWAPSVSLEDGLRRTIEWMREHVDAYRPGAYVV
jgi:dTDP-glucose 4,6-dehydratase